MSSTATKSTRTEQRSVIMAFSFEEVETPIYEVTRVSWTPAAKDLLRKLYFSIKDRKENLPIRDLRLRLMVRDKKAKRVSKDLGQFKDPTLLYTGSDETRALQQANNAVADWAKEALTKQESLDQAAASDLRKLALKQQAVAVERHQAAVYHWERNRRTNSTRAPSPTLFADLADFIADHLVGKEIYPGATPLRRVISSDLNEGKAQLMTDPIFDEYKGADVRFSLGLTVSVETYPGRPLPVIQIKHHKHVWAREPRGRFDQLSGYALPRDEHRALKFEVNSDLTLTDEYKAIARQYALPVDDITATDLATTGTHFQECAVVITHRHGFAEKNSAQRGVTDLDRMLSFEEMAKVLAPHGLVPWNALQLIPTAYKDQKDSDSAWQHLFTEWEKKEDETDQDFQKRVDDAMDEFIKWIDRVEESINQHYTGVHHLVLGFHPGCQKDAERAKEILEHILDNRAKIHLEALPDGVHGSRKQLNPDPTRAKERADQRVAAWLPFIQEIKAYQQANSDTPLSGIIIMAPRWYDNTIDDVINKRAARIALTRELKVAVQYLLPAGRKKDGSVTERQDAQFRMRVVNAWRDLAWKSIGKMHNVDLKLQRSVGTSIEDAPVVLGIGIIRSNRQGKLQNQKSFIPYAIEFDPRTGTCKAAMLLREGSAEPRITQMMELPEAIKVLTANGPSYLVQKVGSKKTGNELDREMDDQRKQLTQNFINTIIAERAQAFPNLVVLLDANTLRGNWTWVADDKIDPSRVELCGDPHAGANFPDAAIVRLRDDHAPKVLKDTARITVTIDGEVRPSATWSSADLYQVTDTSNLLPTYLSFGTRIFKAKRGTSCYRFIYDGAAKLNGPWKDTWSTPNAIEFTVVNPGPYQAEELARLLEALRSEFGHYGSWTKYPAPLHFASFLKEYVPDYELAEEDASYEETEELDNLTSCSRAKPCSNSIKMR